MNTKKIDREKKKKYEDSIWVYVVAYVLFGVLTAGIAILLTI